MPVLAFKNKKVLVIGMGLSGRAAANFLIAQGALVQGVDRDSHLLATHIEIVALKKNGLSICYEGHFQGVEKFDFIVLSPGIPCTHPLVVAARQAGIPLIGEIELGCQFAKNSLLGITGTNGKTTVTLLVTHVLQQCGQKAKALGNVGVPFTSELLDLDSQTTAVLELSSYQLETFEQPCLDTAIILNITPDHLDRYQTLECYAQAKCKIEKNLKLHSPLYIEEKAWRQYGQFFLQTQPRLYGYEASHFIYTNLSAVFRNGEKAFDLPPALKDKRSHELENLLGAYALCADREISGNAFLEAWQTFKKPAHRIELIKEYKGVRYYDDSKGTNIDAVVRAVQSIEGSIILIAGGVDKGTSYTPWVEEFKNKVKLICAIGQAAGKIDEQLASHIPVMKFASLDEAVQQAAQFAKRGDSVLLSPGCASFDMFKDYVHRGQEFQRLVHNLAQLTCQVEAIV